MGAPIISADIARAPDISDRNHRTFMRNALAAAAVAHQLTKSKKHFERNAETAIGGEYGVTPRTKAHEIRKARKYGHRIPNVFTGREKLHTLANSRITKTFRKARVVYRSLHSRPRDQAERWIHEMEAISKQESIEAAQIAHNHYHDQADEFRKTRQRVRIS